MLLSLLSISGYSCLVPKLSVPLMGTQVASVFPTSRRQWSEEATEVRDIQLLSKSYTARPELGQVRAELESPVDSRVRFMPRQGIQGSGHSLALEGVREQGRWQSGSKVESCPLSSPSLSGVTQS